MADFSEKVITTAMSLPVVRVDRDSWLYAQLSKYVPSEQAMLAVSSCPAKAGISEELVGQIADGVIRNHVGLASAGSFATGVPGGWAVLATVPADLAQFYGVALSLAQKLAYLYGWSDLQDSEGHLDEETRYRLILLLGVMMGVAQASAVIRKVADQMASEASRRIPRQAMTRYGAYKVAKQVLRILGVKLTKQSLARGTAKVIPLAGGVVSGGITAVGLSVMAGKLKRHLEGRDLAMS